MKYQRKKTFESFVPTLALLWSCMTYPTVIINYLFYSILLFVDHKHVLLHIPSLEQLCLFIIIFMLLSRFMTHSYLTYDKLLFSVSHFFSIFLCTSCCTIGSLNILCCLDFGKGVCGSSSESLVYFNKYLNHMNESATFSK